MPRPLGRHVEHDPRSRDFPAGVAPLKSVQHVHHGPVLNQGNLGSCTGNAIAQALMTEPLYVPYRNLTEKNAVQFYELATTLDATPGSYPPDDTGSSGLAACKAARKVGDISDYTHAFGLGHALGALAAGPVITGVDWYQGFDHPDPKTGLALPTGQVRGGHELCVIGLDVEHSTVTVLNSWGPRWGLKGCLKWTWDTWDRLLKAKGDVTVPHA